MNTSSKRKILVATFIAILGFGALAQAQISDEQDVSKAKTKISQQQAEAAALKAYPQGKIEESRASKSPQRLTPKSLPEVGSTVTRLGTGPT